MVLWAPQMDGGGAKPRQPQPLTARATAWMRAWLRDGIVPYWKIVALLPRVSPRLTVALATAVGFAAVLPVARTLAAGLLVGSVPAALAAGPDSPETRSTFVLVVLVGVLFIAGWMVGTIRGMVASLLGRLADEHLRERVMRAINRPIGVAHLEDPALRDRLERAQGITGRWSTGNTVGPLATMVGNWLQSIGCTLVLARFSAPLAIALLAAWGIAGHTLRRQYVRSFDVSDEAVKLARRARYLTDLALVPGAGKELRVWGMVDWLRDRFVEAMQRQMQITWADRDRGARLQAMAAVASQAVSFLVLAAVGAAAARGELDLASLATYVGAVAGVAAMAGWGGDSFQLMYGTAALPAVEALERHMADVEEQVTLRGTASPAGMPREGIRLDGVSFRYAGQEGDALSGLDLFIPAGKSLAIVGRTARARPRW